VQGDGETALFLVSSSFLAEVALLRKTKLARDLIKFPFQFNFLLD
jgi:hypothetical protein